MNTLLQFFPSPFRKFFFLCAILFAVCACSQQNNTGQPEENTPVLQIIDGPSDNTASFWQEAAKPFRGITVHGISENTPPSLYVRDQLAPAFAKETGITIELVITGSTAIESAIRSNDSNYDFV